MEDSSVEHEVNTRNSHSVGSGGYFYQRAIFLTNHALLYEIRNFRVILCLIGNNVSKKK